MGMSLIEFLNNLDQKVFQRLKDKQKLSQVNVTEAIQNLESEFPGLSADYKEFLMTLQGGFLLGTEGMINFESLSTVSAFNQHPSTKENFGGKVFIFGDDQLGGVYFFDTGNQFGKGSNAIFNAAFAPEGMEEPAFFAANLTELVEKLAK